MSTWIGINLFFASVFCAWKAYDAARADKRPTGAAWIVAIACLFLWPALLVGCFFKRFVDQER
jgi:hypothetical protein